MCWDRPRASRPRRPRSVAAPETCSDARSLVVCDWASLSVSWAYCRFRLQADLDLGAIGRLEVVAEAKLRLGGWPASGRRQSPAAATAPRNLKRRLAAGTHRRDRRHSAGRDSTRSPDRHPHRQLSGLGSLGRWTPRVDWWPGPLRRRRGIGSSSFSPESASPHDPYIGCPATRLHGIVVRFGSRKTVTIERKPTITLPSLGIFPGTEAGRVRRGEVSRHR